MHGTCTACKSDGPLVLLERGDTVRALCPACAARPDPASADGRAALLAVAALAVAAAAGFAVGWIARGG